MVEITLPIVLQILQTVGILVGIAYYLLIMRNSQRNQELTLKAQEHALETRQLQIYHAVFQPAQIREWMLAYVDVVYNQEWDDYEDFIRKYGPKTNPEAYTSVVQVLELWQMMGMYVENNALDIELVNKHSGRAAMRVWEKLEPFVRGFRVWTNNPMHWHSFEYLYDEMKKLYPQEQTE
jgi:hypothetical protein